MFRTVRAGLIVFCLSLAVAGCGAESDPAETAPSPSASPSDAVTAGPTAEPEETGTASPTLDCSGRPSSFTTAAECLHRAFVADDREDASRFASPEAVETLFALSEPDSWTFHGCDQLGEFGYEPAKVCHFQIPYDVHPTYVQMAMSGEYRVEEVLTVG